MPYGSSFNGMHLSRIDGHILGYKFVLSFYNQQARKLQATLEGCNPKLCPATRSLTRVKCRATSVAKNTIFVYIQFHPKLYFGGSKIMLMTDV